MQFLTRVLEMLSGKERRLMPPHERMLQLHCLPPSIGEGQDFVKLKFTRRNKQQDPYCFPELIEAAQLEIPVPARTPVHSGRTVYVYTLLDELPETSIKLKGAAGLIRPSGLLALEFPMAIHAPRPQVPYNQNTPTAHLHLTPQLDIEIKYESAKAYLSLTLEGAEREYDCLERAHKINCARPPIFAARRIVNNKEEVDYVGRNTGTVASLFGFKSRFVMDYLHFALSDKYGALEYLSDNECMPVNYRNASHAIAETIALCKKMARTKRETLVEAHIARHNGNPNNYIYFEGRDVLLTDLDSALILDTLNQECWGPQMMRDITKDVMRNVEIFTFNCGATKFFDLMGKGAIPIFKEVLEGFFQGYCSDRSIAEAATQLTAGYMALVTKNSRELRKINDAHCAHRRGECSHDLDKLHGQVVTLLRPMHAQVLCLLYKLMHESAALKSKGFILPLLSLGEKDLFLHFAKGVERYSQAYDRTNNPTAQ